MLKEENLKDKCAARNVETFQDHGLGAPLGRILPMYPYWYPTHVTSGIMQSIGIRILLNQLKNQILSVHIDWRFSKSDVLDTF